MAIKILYRTSRIDRKSYNGFRWGGIGEVTTAPDWDPDPKIECGHGLHAIGEGLWGDYLDNSNLLLQVVEAYNPIPADDKWRFESARVVEEYVLPEDVKEVLEKHFIPNLYFMDFCKNHITDEMRRDAFKKLEGELLYCAGLDWDGVTDEMRREAFKKLEGEWLCQAMRDWAGVTSVMIKEAIARLKG